MSKIDAEGSIAGFQVLPKSQGEVIQVGHGPSFYYIGFFDGSVGHSRQGLERYSQKILHRHCSTTIQGTQLLPSPGRKLKVLVALVDPFVLCNGR
jgi:hypothetical protein